MKKIIILAVVFLLGANVALAAPEKPKGNGCGLGAFLLVRTGSQQLRNQPPGFVRGELDRDGKVEGRSDSVAFRLHEVCLENK